MSALGKKRKCAKETVSLYLYNMIYNRYIRNNSQFNYGDWSHRYTITVRVSEQKPYTVRENTWCIGFPPRCSKYKVVFKTIFTTQVCTTKKKTRIFSNFFYLNHCDISLGPTDPHETTARRRVLQGIHTYHRPRSLHSSVLKRLHSRNLRGARRVQV